MRRLLFFVFALSASVLASHAFAASSLSVNIPDGMSIMGCEVTDTCYGPSTNIIIQTGDDITWQNDDTVVHTVTSGTPGGGSDGTFDSGLISPAGSFSHLFDTNGTFDYFCLVHPWMTGSVTVQAVAPASNISFSTDKTSYNVGETIHITGSVVNFQSSLPVTVLVVNPSSKIISIDQTTLDPLGNFALDLLLNSTLHIPDSTPYTIRAIHNTDTATNTFTLHPSVTSAINDMLDDANIAILSQNDPLAAADYLLDVRHLILNNVTLPNENKIIQMINSTIDSFMISGTGGSIHEYPVICGDNEFLAMSSASENLAVVLSSSTRQEISVQSISDYCIPYLIRGGVIQSAHLVPSANSLLIDIDAQSDGELILSLDRSLIDSKNPDNTAKDFVVLADTIPVGVTETVNPTVRVLKIPFSQANAQILIDDDDGTGPPPDYLPYVILAIVVGVVIVYVIMRRSN